MEDTAGAVPNALAPAVRRAQDHLLSLQHADGYWLGELMVDTTLVSDMICFYHWDGKVNPEWQRKAVNHLLANQLPEGGWNIYHGGPAEINATVKAYLALKLAGVPVTDPRMLRAREVAIRMGGVPRMNTFSKLYLALLGLFPWDYVPTIPCEVILLGKWFHVNFWEMSSWTRAMLVPLAIINHFKPTRPLNPAVALDELYPEGMHERDLALPPDPQGLTWRNFFLWVDRLHKFVENYRLLPFRKMSLRKAEQWMLERFEGSDGLAAIFPGVLYGIIALKALGYPEDHPEMVRNYGHLQKLQHETDNQVWFEPCLSPVWDTVITLICLRESGIPADHPAVVKAADWVLDREIRFRGDWQHKNPSPSSPAAGRSSSTTNGTRTSTTPRWSSWPCA
jgi:squalene-hopene/tetraprenyl-beta-curcumene cyclase